MAVARICLTCVNQALFCCTELFVFLFAVVFTAVVNSFSFFISEFSDALAVVLTTLLTVCGWSMAFLHTLLLGWRETAMESVHSCATHSLAHSLARSRNLLMMRNPICLKGYGHQACGERSATINPQALCNWTLHDQVTDFVHCASVCHFGCPPRKRQPCQWFVCTGGWRRLQLWARVRITLLQRHCLHIVYTVLPCWILQATSN